MVLRSTVCLLTLLLLHSAALAEKRMALLIGNEGYSSEIGRLANPHNDVALLEQALKGLGFDVTVERDAGLGALTRAVNAYARRLQAAGPNAVGFFYYSGHGASDGSTNYLIPVDVKTTETGELWDQSLRLTEITRRLKTEAGNATHFVVFDACRNTLKLTQPGSRAVVQSKGFIPVAQESGMLVAYATAEGELASDLGTGAGSYAQILADEIVKPGIEAVAMFRIVQRRVREAIRQEPYLGFSALGDVYFGGRLGSATWRPNPSPQLSEAAEAWDRTKDTTSIALLETYIARYKGTYFAELARARFDELKKQQMAVVVPPITPEPAAKPAMTTPPAPVSPRCDGVEVTVGQSERRCSKLGAGKTEHFKDCPTCPEMVMVPAGSFTMGSPSNEPERRGIDDQLPVTIRKPFAVGRFAVTRGEFAAFVTATGQKMTEGGCLAYIGSEWTGRVDRNWRSPGFTQTDRHPVVCVNWNDAKAYVAWLSSTTGKAYRLLSEVEREYVARAGTTTPFWWGSSITPAQANYDGTLEPYTGGGSKGEYRKATVAVDTFAANAWGLYNVHGNVWEWTEDCWTDRKAGNPGNADAQSAGNCDRVIRGGAWDSDPGLLRSAYRSAILPALRDSDVGFRVARTLAP
jgi:formylglycine-generating enzyme required for sulfatase activity/uncharacterized caspase-like protein